MLSLCTNTTLLIDRFANTRGPTTTRPPVTTDPGKLDNLSEMNNR